jgi:hypothetical protein
VIITEGITQRFLIRVELTPTCWGWLGSFNTHGYGQLWVAELGRCEIASRISWCIYCGSIPQELLVRHSCDNRGCVNPNHLLLGSTLDNAQDRKVRGGFVAENACNVKLTWEDVHAIRWAYEHGQASQRGLAVDYGVAQFTIWSIVNYRSWIES